MSGARDADVLAETVDALAERFVGQYPEQFFTSAREPLAERAEAARQATEPRCHAEALRAPATTWPLRALDTDALAEALTRSLRARARRLRARPTASRPRRTCTSGASA